MPLLDKLREQYGVGPVCSELHVAPSTYYHCQQQRHHPEKRSAAFFKVVVAFCNKVTLCSLFFWIQVDF